MSSAVKIGKKKPLKSLITFHSKEIYERATSETNTSALVEALLARHFGIDISGDTMQAKLRRDALDDMLAPVPVGLNVSIHPSTPAAAPEAPAPFELPSGDELNHEDGDLDEQFTPSAEEGKNPLTAEVGVMKELKVADDLLPDRPEGHKILQVDGSFGPVPANATYIPSNQVEPTPEPVTAGQYEPGTRLCPTCGNDMGTFPHCLVCL